MLAKPALVVAGLGNQAFSSSDRGHAYAGGELLNSVVRAGSIVGRWRIFPRGDQRPDSRSRSCTSGTSPHRLPTLRRALAGPASPGRSEAMPYVDGFVVPVPKKNIEAYRAAAEKMGQVWKEHGALEYHEYIADDVKPGKFTSFPQSVDLKDDETVVFSWIVYPDRATRDRVNEKVMADPRIKDEMSPDNMVFDGKRMIF